MLFNKQRGNGEEKEERQRKFEQKNRLLTGEDEDLYSEVRTEGARRRRRVRGEGGEREEPRRGGFKRLTALRL